MCIRDSLLTDDGELAHRLLSPKKQVAKVYEALVDGRMDETDQLAFQKGLDIGDEKPALPAVLKILKKGERSLVEITVTEGRFHQVKRMCRAVGKMCIRDRSETVEEESPAEYEDSEDDYDFEEK